MTKTSKLFLTLIVSTIIMLISACSLNTTWTFKNESSDMYIVVTVFSGTKDEPKFALEPDGSHSITLTGRVDSVSFDYEMIPDPESSIPPKSATYINYSSSHKTCFYPKWN